MVPQSTLSNFNTQSLTKDKWSAVYLCFVCQ